MIYNQLLKKWNNNKLLFHFFILEIIFTIITIVNIIIPFIVILYLIHYICNQDTSREAHEAEYGIMKTMKQRKLVS